jgi:hypothetical protein
VQTRFLLRFFRAARDPEKDRWHYHFCMSFDFLFFFMIASMLYVVLYPCHFLFTSSFQGTKVLTPGLPFELGLRLGQAKTEKIHHFGRTTDNQVGPWGAI